MSGSGRPKLDKTIFRIGRPFSYDPKIHAFLKEHRPNRHQDMDKFITEVSWDISMVVWSRGDVAGVALLKKIGSDAKILFLAKGDDYYSDPIIEVLRDRLERSKKFSLIS